MNALKPGLFVLFVFAPAAYAMECANAVGGTAPSALPDDVGNGNSIACGSSAYSSGHQSTAIGYGATSGGSFSAALAVGSSAAGTASIALGTGTFAIGLNSSAIGSRAYAPNDNTMVLGGIPGINNGFSYTSVGIGTFSPTEAVEVERVAASARFQLTSFTNTATEAPQYIQRRARGTSTLPVPVQNGDNLGLFSFRGHNGVGMGGSRATITAQAAADFSNSSTPTRLIFATTPVGQTVPQQVLVITPDGKVQVNGQNLIVPDYVFEDDYPLMPLEELRNFIDENGHLPGIAPAHEVNENGHDLAGSDMAHLRKIEELTLYTLQQHDRIRMLEERLVAQGERHADELASLRQEMQRLGR